MSESSTTSWGSRTGARLTNLYGPTEATVDVSYFDCPTHNDFESIPIGRPIHNTRLYVIRGRPAGGDRRDRRAVHRRASVWREAI